MTSTIRRVADADEAPTGPGTSVMRCPAAQHRQFGVDPDGVPIVDSGRPERRAQSDRGDRGRDRAASPTNEGAARGGEETSEQDEESGTTTSPGVTLTASRGLDGLVDADLLVLPAFADHSGYPDAVIDAVRAAADSGATILTVCSGSFLAGAAGLLDGRTCTTHWSHADELARAFPAATVDPDVLFVDEGTLVTSAGTAAGIDACLHVVRRELGTAVANTIARRMVVAPQRAGGQRQFIE